LEDGFQRDNALTRLAIGAFQFVERAIEAIRDRAVWDCREMIDLAEAATHGRHRRLF
jgi:hypothetical protein